MIIIAVAIILAVCASSGAFEEETIEQEPFRIIVPKIPAIENEGNDIGTE